MLQDKTLLSFPLTALGSREVADSRSWDIFIRDAAYFIVIQQSMTLCFIKITMNKPYPVWKCLMYECPQPPYCHCNNHNLLEFKM